MTGKKRPMIIGPKSDTILAGALTVASGAWLIGILLGDSGRTGATSLAC